MAFDEKRLGRLARAFEYSRREMQTYRQQRTESLRQLVGGNYSDSGAAKPVPVNLIEMAVSIYRRQIAARAPRVMVSTEHRHLNASARRLESALNVLIQQIGLAQALEDWVTDAMFGVGVLKAGRDEDGIFGEAVDLDDWVQDMQASRLQRGQFAGNRFVLDKEDVLDRYEVQERDLPGRRSSQHDDGVTKASAIGKALDDVQSELDEQIELWDIWVERDGVLYTFLADGSGKLVAEQPIKETEVDRIDGAYGPYHRLAFEEVPANALPLPPISLLRDLHELANGLFRKLRRQAERQKTGYGVRGSAQPDGRRVVEFNDGDVFALDDPAAVREFTTGGIYAPSLAFFLNTKNLFSDMAGNLDVLGGLSPQSGTLGQDEILNQNATMRLAEMQEKAVVATVPVVRRMARLIWDDRSVDLPVTLEVEGTDIVIPSRFNRKTRKGDLIDYAIDVHPYSMTPATPPKRLASLMAVLERMVLPLVPSMQAQGLTVDVRELLETVSDLADLPELRTIITQVPENGAGGGSGDGQFPSDRPIQSPVTTRRQVRVGQPGAGRRGAESQMAASLMAQNGQMQPASAAS